MKKMSASELAEQMGLRVRDYSYHGKHNDNLITIKSPGTSDEDKKLLMDFAKRTGLKNVPQGSNRQRYFCGNCHWMVVFKRKEFDRAKGLPYEPQEEEVAEPEKLTPPPRPQEDEYEEDIEEEFEDETESPNYRLGGSIKLSPHTPGALERRMAAMESKFDKLMKLVEKKLK